MPLFQQIQVCIIRAPISKATEKSVRVKLQGGRQQDSFVPFIQNKHRLSYNIYSDNVDLVLTSHFTNHINKCHNAQLFNK